MFSVTGALSSFDKIVQKLRSTCRKQSNYGISLLKKLMSSHRRYELKGNASCSVSCRSTNMSPLLFGGVGATCSHQLGQSSNSMELDILDKKIRRLVQKLRKHEVQLEVFNPEDIKYGAVIGQGGEAIVYQCTIMYNSLPVDAAVKRVLNNSDDALSITLDEIELLCLAWDPIVTTTLQVYGVAAVPDEPGSDVGHLVIITEAGLMNALQLYQQEEIPLCVSLNFWSRLAAAIYCMHTKHIIHQDLKPENILITGVKRDRMGQCQGIDFKVIDLGMGKRFFTEKVAMDEILGTNGYHAPEVLLDESHDFRADVFMLGITFSVLLHGPMFLKGSCLPNLLLQIHEAKHRGTAGRLLFDATIGPSIDVNLDLPFPVRSMLCQMLAKQERRNLSLPEVVAICREQSAILVEQSQDVSPALLSSSSTKSSTRSHSSGYDTDGQLPSTRRKTKRKEKRSGGSRPTTPPIVGRRSNRLKNIPQSVMDKLTPRRIAIVKRLDCCAVVLDNEPPAKRTRQALRLM